jgi:histidine triad (HIT) family protein
MLRMEDSVFTKIIKGEIPCHKVYEDERSLAFLTINPVRDGHTLVIPKQQIESIWDLDDELYQALMTTTKKVAQRIDEVLRPVRVGIHVAGLEVPHAHVHVLPFATIDEFLAHPSGDEPDHAKLAAIAQRLYFE